MTAARNRLVVFTDLDGTLLDAATYSYAPARPALKALAASGAPLVFCTSKTRAETEVWRRRLGNRSPFVVENGGAVFIPRGAFPFPFEPDRREGGYDVVVLGADYARLRAALEDIRVEIGGLRGFGDMGDEEVARLTGLPPGEAALARRREFDEPFVLEGPGEALAIEAMAEARGLRVTRGGRFFHLTGPSDKGAAVRRLVGLYARTIEGPLTAALGDSGNDRPMLEAVDIPVLVARPDGSHDPAIDLPGLRRTPGAGPTGWNAAVLEILRQTAAPVRPRPRVRE